MKSLSAFAAIERSYPSRLCGRYKYKVSLCLWNYHRTAPRIAIQKRKVKPEPNSPGIFLLWKLDDSISNDEDKDGFMKDTRLLKIFNDTKDILCKYDYYIHTVKRILHLTNTELKIPHLMGLQYVGRPNQYAGDFGVYAVKKGRITLESLEKLVKKYYKTKENVVFDTIVNLVMIFTLLVCFLPFVYMAALSFSSSKAIINNQVLFWPVGFNLDAYKQIFTYPNFFQAYGNTFIYTIGGTTIAMLMTIMFAYPLSKDNLMGHKFFMKIVVISMFFAGGMIPNYLLVSSLHLTGTRWAMLLPFCISQFNLIIMINSFKSLPHELEEAALIDGLGYWGILRRIIVPLSTAAIATVGLYYAVFFWNDWFNSLIYLNKEQYPVMLFLRNIVNGTAMVGDGAGSADKSSLGIAIKSAVIIVSTLPIIILYPFLQKYFVKGLTVGGVKG